MNRDENAHAVDGGELLSERAPASPCPPSHRAPAFPKQPPTAITTQRIRRHFLDEYLQHAQQAVGAIDIVVGELMDPARTGAWLLDAAAGNTRTRNTLGGPDAAAYPNSMRVRIDSYNAFAEFLCLPDRYDSQVLGTPLRPGAFRASGLSRSRSSQRTL